MQEDDNDAYMAAYKEYDERNKANGRNPFEVAEIFTAGGDRFEAFFSGPEKIFCFNHIAKSRCKSYGRAVVQSFVDRFNLDTYQGRYFYCVHPILQPLMYGWFPFNKFVNCPKIEKLL